MLGNRKGAVEESGKSAGAGVSRFPPPRSCGATLLMGMVRRLLRATCAALPRVDRSDLVGVPWESDGGLGGLGHTGSCLTQLQE